MRRLLLLLLLVHLLGPRRLRRLRLLLGRRPRRGTGLLRRKPFLPMWPPSEMKRLQLRMGEHAGIPKPALGSMEAFAGSAILQEGVRLTLFLNRETVDLVLCLRKQFRVQVFPVDRRHGRRRRRRATQYPPSALTEFEPHTTDDARSNSQFGEANRMGANASARQQGVVSWGGAQKGSKWRGKWEHLAQRWVDQHKARRDGHAKAT